MILKYRDKFNNLIEEKVLFGTIRNKIIRLTTANEMNRLFISYELNNNNIIFLGVLGGKTYDEAQKTTEGTFFKGWKNTKQYRMTTNEINILIKNKEFILKLM